MLRAFRHPFVALVGALALGLPSCGRETTSPGPLPLAGVVGVAGSAQFALIGSTLPRPLIARAVDASGNGVAGTVVTFTVTNGGGSVVPATVTTDAAGLAQTTWTLGSLVGFQGVDVSAGGLPPSHQFSASGFIPQLFLTAGGGQIGETNSTLQVPIEVGAFSPNFVPVPGFQLTFQTVNPLVNGSASPLHVLTDVNGFATTDWTLGDLVGTQRMTVTFPGLATPLQITATGFTIIPIRDPGIPAAAPPIR